MSYEAYGDVKELRTRQILSLHSYFSDVEHENNDTLSLRVDIKGTAYVLKIFLPQGFPIHEPPVLQLSPNGFRHRFVASNGVVRNEAHPKLANWSLNNELGRIVFDLIRSLNSDDVTRNSNERNVSYVNTNVQGGVYGYPNSGNYSQMNPQMGNPSPNNLPRTFGTNPNENQDKPEDLVFKTEIPQSFEQIESLSNDEIGELLSNKEAFKEFFLNMPQIINNKELSEEMKQSNQEAIETNQQIQLEIADLQSNHTALQQELQNIKQTYDETFLRKQNIEQRFSNQNMATALQELVYQIEDETEDMSQSFLDGDESNITSFLRDYTKKRQQYHQRALKIQKLSTQRN